jgi:mono/diheme cytochrome c family protein
MLLRIGNSLAAAAFIVLAAPLCAATPTFTKDIFPILQKNCQVCHRPGEIGPMSFLTYETTRPWAKAIKNAVLTSRMPPWFADPNYGHFQNDRKLSEADVRAIAAWVDAGAPEGDTKDRPPAVAWTEGWNIRPDIVLQMPEPYPIPATGTLEYAYLVIPSGFTKDTWVTGAEIRPGNRSVVHHINAVVRPRGSRWMKDAKPFEPFVPPPSARDGQPDVEDPQAGTGPLNIEFLAGYSPGMQAQRFDVDHSAKLIPAGADIVLQLHYTPNGKSATQDQTKIGLTLATQPPAKRFMSAVASGWRWTIPPGDSNYEGHARLTFGEPVELVSLQPHMHLRGKDMSVQIVLPSGETQTVLAVPHYDFDWQIVYYLAEPLKLPSGTRVEVTAHWDNSANNRRNPDPAKEVKWGNQSSDEMLSLPMSVIIDN